MNLSILSTSCTWIHIKFVLCVWIIVLSISSRFILLGAFIRAPFFLWLYAISSYVYTIFCSFIHLFVVMGYFHLMAIRNNAAISISEQDMFQSLLSISLGIYLKVESLDHTIIPCLAFSGTIKMFSKAAMLLYISTSSVQGFQRLHILIDILFYGFLKKE